MSREPYRPAPVRQILLLAILSFLSVSVPGSAYAITPEQYREHCGTEAGREKLIALQDAPTRTDLRLQAEGLGVDPEMHLRNKMVESCAYFAPGTVQPESPTQSWTFLLDAINEPGEGVSFITYSYPDPPRCGPRCAGKFTLKIDPRWQVCRISYRTDYESNGPWRGDISGAHLIIKPALWMDDGADARFQGVTFEAEAHRQSHIQVRDIRIDAVDAAFTPEQRREKGCLVPARTYTERVGRAECGEDHGHSAFRHRDHCAFTHRAVGSRTSVRKYNMRKIVVSKPAGSTGRERIIERNRGSILRESVLLPGQSRVLLSKSGDTFTDHAIEIITTDLGADGRSPFKVDLEWFRP